MDGKLNGTIANLTGLVDMKAKQRAILRKQKTRSNRQLSNNLKADAVGRSPYVVGSYSGFNVNARSVVISTPAGTNLRGVSVTAKSLGKRFAIQRAGRGFAI